MKLIVIDPRRVGLNRRHRSFLCGGVAISIELWDVMKTAARSASGDNMAHETLRFLGDPQDEARFAR